MARITGTVLWFNASKAFGFLEVTGHPDVFCHYSAIQNEGCRELRAGETVEFEIVMGGQGCPQAANLRVVVSATGQLTRPLTALAVKPISEYN